MNYIFIFLIGLAFGSFINVVIYRLPKGMTLSGRSHCPKCKSKIAWYDNIPLLSFLLLGGKCRNCKKPISIRYPVIELATAIAFVLLWPNIIYMILFLILLSIFVIDLTHQIIPDSLVFIGLLFSLLLIHDSPFAYLFSGFFFALLLLLIHLFTKGRGMGLGDVKFAIFAGTFLGIEKGAVWLFTSFLTGGLLAIILVLWGKKDLKDKIAFGPFLVIAIPLSLLLNYLSVLPLLDFWPF